MCALAALRVAVLQMTSTPDVTRNLDILTKLIRKGVDLGAQLVVAPEGFAYLGPEDGKVMVAEDINHPGPILNRCMSLVLQSKVELVLGGFWERSSVPNKTYNTCLHIDAFGKIKAAYRKIHLFDVDLPDGTSIRESSTMVSGSDVVVTQTNFGTLGLSICYDVRFPELYRKLVDLGAIALAVPSAFTLTTGKEHWHPLLKARAIESQAYVLAAAQTGHHYANRYSYGHALICDPWGCVIAQCSEGEGVAIATIEPDRVQHIRASFPMLKHRRL